MTDYTLAMGFDQMGAIDMTVLIPFFQSKFSRNKNTRGHIVTGSGFAIYHTDKLIRVSYRVRVDD